MYGVTSSGGVGIGQSSPFGTRFGYYAQILRDQVARNWRTEQIDPRLKTAPLVIVTFELLRSGAIRDVRVLQSSGHFELDNSCQRAIYDAQPFPPLPAGFERNSAVIEFQFQLRR
jgi:protein TonB